jgi:UDP-GlcNAc:undecaprenyl-phosphate GlcNAc-1-phosphate transferase
MEHVLVGSLVCLATFSAAVICVPFAKSLALRFRIIDHPNERKVHAVPMPRSGGVAVCFSFTTVVLLGFFSMPHLLAKAWFQQLFPGSSELLRDAHQVQWKLLALLGGGLLAFVIGFLDDFFGLRFPVAAKLAGQTLAALVLVAADVRTQFLPLPWMNTLLTVLWLVGITNAFNLLDNTDGLSSGVAFVASSVFLINAVMLGEYFVCFILIAFMGSLLGFLVFNFPPAKIFLGDCGSLYIGLILGGLTLLERFVSHASSTLFPILMPVIVLAVPIIDTATVVIIRLREHRPIYVGDRRHLSHRLLALGFSPRAAALILYLATFCFGIGAVLLPHASVAQSLLVLVQGLGFLGLLLILMFFVPSKSETPARCCQETSAAMAQIRASAPGMDSLATRGIEP